MAQKVAKTTFTINWLSKRQRQGPGSSGLIVSVWFGDLLCNIIRERKIPFSLHSCQLWAAYKLNCYCNAAKVTLLVNGLCLLAILHQDVIIRLNIICNFSKIVFQALYITSWYFGLCQSPDTILNDLLVNFYFTDDSCDLCVSSVLLLYLYLYLCCICICISFLFQVLVNFYFTDDSCDLCMSSVLMLLLFSDMQCIWFSRYFELHTTYSALAFVMYMSHLVRGDLRSQILHRFFTVSEWG